MSDTRHPGLITPDNAPRLADLDDDSTPYPAQLTITCDFCPGEHTADYLVPAESTSTERFEIARKHLRTIGWSCDESGDFCPGCAMRPVLAEIQAERMRQIAKWGVQHRKDGTGAESDSRKASLAKSLCRRAEEFDGGATWRQVLVEEFFEAVAEADPAALRAELVQVAAVAAAWIEDIDSRTAGA